MKYGDRGPEVKLLQTQLVALGKEVGDIDGWFGIKTHDAVEDFQDDYPHLTVDGIAGPQTQGQIDQALRIHRDDAVDAPPHPAEPPSNLQCTDEVWDGFMELVKLVTAEDPRDACVTPTEPVRYGPGRGLFVDGEFVVTYGPGKLDYKTWKSELGRTFPSFHCSSWTNFFMGWVSRRNEQYTHSGNIPSLFNLCELSPALQENKGLAKYRGYSDICSRFESDGSSRKRTGIGDKRVVDLQELYERRHELPTFFVCGQSSKKNGKWKWWHHTVLFVVDHRQEGSPMYRIAADGYKGRSGAYSGTPMRYAEVSAEFARSDFMKHVYRGYTITPYEGERPLCSAVLEP